MIKSRKNEDTHFGCLDQQNDGNLNHETTESALKVTRKSGYCVNIYFWKWQCCLNRLDTRVNSANIKHRNLNRNR